jgi:hypothetical protein
MRIKTIEKDGAKYQISPLTLSQVEQLFDLLRTQKEPHESAFFVLETALNNAASGHAAEPVWSTEKIRNEFDLVTLPWIHQEILDFSGLKAVPSEGETQAAAQGKATSPESAAA